MNNLRLFLILFIPWIAYGIGSSYTAKEIDRISVNTESQITLSDTVRFSSGTASTVPYLDANKDLTSSAVTPTELGYVSGVTSALQTQLNAKEGTLTNSAGLASALSDESGTGVVLFGTNPAITGPNLNFGTASNSIRLLLPSDTTTNLDLLTDTAGLLGYDTTQSKPVYNNGSGWQAIGSGAGGSRLNLVPDPSFETDVSEGTCTGCTASQETSTSIVKVTDTNAAALKMAFSAASGDYTDTITTGSQFTNVSSKVSAWIKTSASDCHLVEMVDGAESQTVAVSSEDEWKLYEIYGTTGATSYGYRVECNTSITDDVYVDEVYAGPVTEPIFDIAQAQFYGSVQWATTTNCAWSRAAASFADFSADADCDDNARTIEGMYNSTNGDAANSDGQKPQIKFSYMPAGTYFFKASGLFYASSGNCTWRFSDGTNSSNGGEINDGLATASYGEISGSITYTTDQTSETTINIQSYLSGGTSCDVYSEQVYRKLKIEVYYYPSPQKVFASKCDGLECENEFAAKIGSTGTVASENVDWIASASNPSTGSYTINFTSGLFSEAPVCVSIGVSGTRDCYGNGNPSTASWNIHCRDESAVAIASDIQVKCSRQGSDYNQFDQRFVPVVDPEARYAAITASDVTATADTLLQLIVEKDDYGLVDTTNDKFDIDKTGEYQLCAGGNIAAGTANWAAFYYRINAGGNEYFNGMAPSASSGVTMYPCKTISLVAGDDLYLRTQSGSTSAISIIRATLQLMPDKKKAFIGNLTPTEFVQTPGSVKPVSYSATVSSSGVVSLEVGDFINGDCTNAAPMVCTFTSGAFSQEPNCTISNSDSVDYCTFEAFSSTSMSLGCYTNAGTARVQVVEKKVVCHGVQ